MKTRALSGNSLQILDLFHHSWLIPVICTDLLCHRIVLSNSCLLQADEECCPVLKLLVEHILAYTMGVPDLVKEETPALELEFIDIREPFEDRICDKIP